MGFHHSIALFMDYCQSKQLRPKTMASYEQTLKLFARWMEEEKRIARAEDVTEQHVREYIIDLQKRGKYTFCFDDRSMKLNRPTHRRDYRQAISNITINNYLSNMKVFFAWMVDTDCIVLSPMKKIHLLPQERKPKEYLEDDEVKALLRAMDRSYFPEYRDLIVMMIMLDAGTRLGETLSATVEQLNVAEKSLHLPANKTKGRRDRTVFFSAKTAKELRRWLQYKDRYCDSRFLFPVKHSGCPLTVESFETNFSHYVKRSGIKKHVSPHTLRNNFAKRCLMAGMDIYTLSKILGHSSVTITEQAYLDVTDADIKKRYSKFSPVENIYYGERD
ncbi:MAG: tyrosine-type recombinase/integrase [Clostridia bacterium]|nr:tyrosine-type recombinase/integrase [Clostridia bacterium]